MTKAYFGNRSLDSVDIKCSFYCPHWKKLLTSADNENSTADPLMMLSHVDLKAGAEALYMFADLIVIVTLL